VTLYFIEPQEFASKHGMRRIACFDVNDENLVALAGPSRDDSQTSRIIVKPLSSDAYLFETVLTDLVRGIALSHKGDMVAICSDAAVRVWDIASESLLLTRETAGVVGAQFNEE
jgi:hypothetical protein